MIVYVDLEHDRLRNDPQAGAKSLADCLQAKYRLQEASGQPCLIVRYQQANPLLLREVKAQAVIISGCLTDFEHYSQESLVGLREIYHQVQIPLLGICAGHQLLAEAYGGDIGAMGQGNAGRIEELGFLPVDLSKDHPLFAGISSPANFHQNHYWEIKRLPPTFQNLAASMMCPIQIIVHHERPLFGIQFHSEKYDEAHPDGRKLLENFFHFS